jgi:hypothetical protein
MAKVQLREGHARFATAKPPHVADGSMAVSFIVQKQATVSFMALLSYGVHALVGQSLTEELIGTITLHYRNE